jgi:hypothetical protein
MLKVNPPTTLESLEDNFVYFMQKALERNQ